MADVSASLLISSSGRVSNLLGCFHNTDDSVVETNVIYLKYLSFVLLKKLVSRNRNGLRNNLFI